MLPISVCPCDEIMSIKLCILIGFQVGRMFAFPISQFGQDVKNSLVGLLKTLWKFLLLFLGTFMSHLSSWTLLPPSLHLAPKLWLSVFTSFTTCDMLWLYIYIGSSQCILYLRHYTFRGSQLVRIVKRRLIKINTLLMSSLSQTIGSLITLKSLDSSCSVEIIQIRWQIFDQETVRMWPADT